MCLGNIFFFNKTENIFQFVLIKQVSYFNLGNNLINDWFKMKPSKTTPRTLLINVKSGNRCVREQAYFNETNFYH